MIHGMTVCVGYSDLLDRGIDQWMSGLDSLLIVTSSRDPETSDMFWTYGTDVRLYRTESFWDNGALFNKGKAMAEAFHSGLMPADDWILFFDADVVPRLGWREQIEDKIQPGNLYGAKRRQVLEDGTMAPHIINDRDPCGFFLLFHGSDPNAKAQPIVDTHWYHAANYDTTFMRRWAPNRRHVLGLELLHYGPTGSNWCGKGNTVAMDALYAERARRGGFAHEVCDGKQ